MILGIFGKGKKRTTLEEIEEKYEMHDEMILSGKGIPPLGEVKPLSEEEKRIQQMILNGEGIPPLTEDCGMKLTRRK